MRAWLLFVVVPALAGGAWACEPVALDAGEAEVAGSTSEGAEACFVVPAGEGQRLRIRILEGGEVGFGVEGVIDGQEDYAFVAMEDAYRVRVAPLPGAAPSQPFLLGVSVAEGVPTTGWHLEEGDGRASGRAWIREPGGPSFALACSPQGLSLTYDGLGTAALASGPEKARGAIEIEVDGEVRRHPVTLVRYDGFDRYWEATEGLAAALGDFASGSVLRLLDAEGSVAGRVGLEGSGRLRRAVSERCGL